MRSKIYVVEGFLSLSCPTNLRRHVMERAADVIDTINRIKPRQYVVIERSGRRLIFDFDMPGSGLGEMPIIKPLDSK